MTGLRDTNGAETRDAWERLIELGELDSPPLQKIRVRNLHHLRQPPREFLRLNQKITLDRSHLIHIKVERALRARWLTPLTHSANQSESRALDCIGLARVDRQLIQ